MKPLQLTSSTHAFAYGVYSTQAGFGLCMLIGAVSAKALAALLFVPVLGAALLISGLLGLYAIRIAKTEPNPDSGLRLERVAAWVIGIVNMFFSVALFIQYGFSTGLVTQVYVLGVVIPCAFRVRQIQSDRRKLRAALNQAKPADDATLAEPPNDDK